jgi:hypothetical protein
MRIPTDEAGRKAHLQALLEDFEAIYGVPLRGHPRRRSDKIMRGRWHYVRTAMLDGFTRPEITEALGVDFTTVYRLSRIDEMC